MASFLPSGSQFVLEYAAESGMNCDLGGALFWIAQAMFAGFAVSSLAGGVARVIAYRRGLV